MNQEFVQIRQLNKYFNRKTKREIHVINNTSLTLPEKGLVCILGESGSGKTTLMHAVGALDTFASGSIEVAGKKLTGRMNRDAENLRNEEYGFIFQNYYLLNDETVYENLKLALCLYTISSEEQEERIDYVLRAVEMDRYKKRKVSELSGGQRQRVAIARALIRTPRVIFADEPVGNLDENNTMLVMGILKKVSQNTLVVLTTHEKRLARFFADRIIRISDGKVISDEKNEPLGSYQLADDKNIYLGEYRHQTVLSDAVAIEAYGDFDVPLTMQLVEREGMYYFALPEGTKAEILTKDSEVQIKGGKHLALEQEEIENREYNLKKIAPKKEGMLSGKQIVSMVIKALGAGSKKLRFAILCMFATAVLTSIVVADFVGLLKTDPTEFVITNSKLVHIKMERDDWISSADYGDKIVEIVDELWETSSEWTIYPVFSAEIHVRNQQFEQVAELSEFFSGYSITPLSLMDENTLIMGRMPVMPNEVVVDQAVLKAFMERNNLVSASYNEPEQFLDMELFVLMKDYNWKIVGICDSGEQSVYIEDVAGIGYAVGGVPLASLSKLKELYPEQFGDTVLRPDEILMNEGRVEIALGYKWYSVNYDSAYRIMGSYPKEFTAVYVILDEAYGEILKQQICRVREFVIYAEDKEEVLQHFVTLGEEYDEQVRFVVTDDYGQKLSSFLAERNAKLGARALVTVMILVLSLMMLALSMKTMAMQNVENISVYRLMGIRDKSIMRLYGCIITVLSVCTTLPGAALCAVVLKSVTGIKALKLDYLFEFPVMLATILVLFVLNLCVGLIPIRKIVNTPPAQLAAKADI